MAWKKNIDLKGENSRTWEKYIRRKGTRRNGRWKI